MPKLEKKLSMRAKILLVVAGNVLVFSVLMYVISSQVLLQSYQFLEQKAVIQDLNRGDDAIKSFIHEQIVGKMRDWAQWDDPYNYVRTFYTKRNVEFEKNILIYSALPNLNINVMMFTDLEGKAVSMQVVDLPDGTPVFGERTATLQTLMTAENRIARHTGIEDYTEGLLMVPEGPLAFGSRPLSKSNGDGPTTGALTFARYLDSAKVKEIADTIHLAMDVFPYASTTLDADVALAKEKLSQGEPYFVVPHSFDVVAGYTVINDIHGDPALILRVLSDRPIYAQGQLTFVLFMGIGAAALLFFGFGIFFLLDQFFIARFEKLGREVGGISKSDDFSRRLPKEGDDEVGVLSAAINSLLDAISKTRETEKEVTKKAEGMKSDLEMANRQMERMNTVMVDKENEVAKLKKELSEK